MMGNWDYGNMMGGPSAGSGWGWFGSLGLIFWLVILVDLILLGFWLWKKIQEK